MLTTSGPPPKNPPTVTPRRLRNLLNALPITVGSGFRAARKVRSRARARQHNAEIRSIEALEPRVVLSSVRLNLTLADDDAVLSSEHFATSDAYDGTLQPLGDGYFRYGDPPTVIQVKTTWDSVRIIASDDITHELNRDTFDAATTEVFTATADLLGSGASFSTTPLIGRPVPGSNGGVIESGDSDGDAESGGSGGGSYTSDGRIVSQLRTETVASPGIVRHELIISDTRDRTVKDGSGFSSLITVVTSPHGSIASDVAPVEGLHIDLAEVVQDASTTVSVSDFSDTNSDPEVPTVERPVETFEKQLLMGPSRPIASPTSPIRDLNVVFVVDPQVTEALRRDEVAGVVSDLRSYVIHAQSSGRFRTVSFAVFTVRTKTPSLASPKDSRPLRRSVVVRTVNPPAAPFIKVQTRTRSKPTQIQAASRDVPQSVSPPESLAKTTDSGEATTRHGKPVHRSDLKRNRADEPVSSDNRLESADLTKSINRSAVAGPKTVRFAPLQLTDTVDTQAASLRVSVITDTQSALEGVLSPEVITEPASEIRNVSLPEHAVVAGSSGTNERTNSEHVGVRLVIFGVNESIPVLIDRPREPAIESLILQQLEFEQAPRGPPLIDAVAPGFEFNRASELRLKMLKHSQAPRSPSVVSAN